MSSILSFPERLLEQARRSLDRGQWTDATRALERIIWHPAVNPSLVAEANYLLAQVRFSQADVVGARQSALRALENDADRADFHFLLSEVLHEDGDDSGALEHLAASVRLDPEDSAKVVRYAQAVAEQKSAERGLRLMQSAYADHVDDPQIVAAVVDGYMDQNRWDDAELVIRQVMYRHGQDARFRRIHDRFRAAFCEMRLRQPTVEVAPSECVPYRNPALMASSKPGGARRPDRDETPRRPQKPAASSTRSEPPVIDEGMSCLELLRRSGTAASATIYDALGLLGKEEPREQAADVASFLADADTLAHLVRGLPLASRRLLKTLVSMGGYVPAAALFQTEGPDAPPPDYAQPLLSAGLVFFGRPVRGRVMMAAVPVDLLGKLMKILRIRKAE